MKPLPNMTALLVLSFFLTGFSLDNAMVPRSEILAGGPPKDGIPAILKPVLVSAEQADFMAPGDPVIGVIIAGEPRAYPIKILNWHEVVNDAAEGEAFAVTF